MKNKEERCDIVISGRITASEKSKMQEHGIKVRDAIQVKIALEEDPHRLLRYRRNILKNEIRTLKHQLKAKESELKEINEELGFQNEKGIIFDVEVQDAGKTILERYKNTKGTSNLTIDDYLESKDGKRIVKNQIGLYGGGNKEEFKNMLNEYVKENCKH